MAGTSTMKVETEEVEITHGVIEIVKDPSHVSQHTDTDTQPVKPDEPEQTQATLPPMQALFDKTVCDKLGLPYKYTNVNVLLIRWVKYLDKDSKCPQELVELQDVFQNKFNYPTEVLELSDKIVPPQLQLNCGIGNFVAAHNGSCRSTLLIVYYTGHGFRDENGELWISGVRDPKNVSLGTYEANAQWNEAESCLRRHASADVLVILDSCFAGSAIKGATEDIRSFETLAACRDVDTTAIAGPRSFSRALIDALADLAERPVFTTYDLNTEIIARRHHKSRQKSQVFTKPQAHTHRWIMLAPLLPSFQQTKTPDPAILIPKVASQVTVRFTLGNIASLSEDNTVALATSLCRVEQDSGLDIKKIELLKVVKLQENTRKKKSATSPMEPWRLLVLVIKAQRFWRQRAAKNRAAKRPLEEDGDDSEHAGKRHKGPLTPNSAVDG